MDGWLIGLIFSGAAILLLAGFLIWRPIRAAMRENQFIRANRDFHRHRERLEAKFFDLAARSGKPRGLRWTNCDFEDAVAYARDRKTGELSAFVGVTISFEAIEGGPMEDVEAVSNLRAATAVFHFGKDRWRTEGRAVFNLSPAQAIDHFRREFEVVAPEPAQRS